MRSEAIPRLLFSDSYSLPAIHDNKDMLRVFDSHPKYLQASYLTARFEPFKPDIIGNRDSELNQE
jgi:hypothetical protein